MWLYISPLRFARCCFATKRQVFSVDLNWLASDLYVFTSALNCAVLFAFASDCKVAKSVLVLVISVLNAAVMVELFIVDTTSPRYPSRYALVQVTDASCTCNCCTAYCDLVPESANAADGKPIIAHAINAAYWSLVCMKKHQVTSL